MKIKQLNSVSEIVESLRKLEKEFTLTNFQPVISLLEGITPYNFEASLEWTEEGSYDSPSTQILEVGHVPTRGHRIYWKWETSGGHTVTIEGRLNRDDGYQLPYNQELDGEFILSIGDDESEYFYPTVKSVLNY